MIQVVSRLHTCMGNEINIKKSQLGYLRYSLLLLLKKFVKTISVKMNFCICGDVVDRGCCLTHFPYV